MAYPHLLPPYASFLYLLPLYDSSELDGQNCHTEVKGLTNARLPSYSSKRCHFFLQVTERTSRGPPFVVGSRCNNRHKLAGPTTIN